MIARQHIKIITNIQLIFFSIKKQQYKQEGQPSLVANGKAYGLFTKQLEVDDFKLVKLITLKSSGKIESWVKGEKVEDGSLMMMRLHAHLSKHANDKHQRMQPLTGLFGFSKLLVTVLLKYSFKVFVLNCNLFFIVSLFFLIFFSTFYKYAFYLKNIVTIIYCCFISNLVC